MIFIFISSLLLQFLILGFINNLNLYSNVSVYITFTLILITGIVIKLIPRIKYKNIILISFIIRVITMLIDLYGKSYIRILHSGGDTEGFYRSGLLYGSGQYSIIEDELYGGYYSKVLGSIFRFIGDQRIFAQYLNVVLAMLTILLLIEILINLEINLKIQNWIIWIIAIFPTNIILSSILLRESIVLFFITLGLYFYSRSVYRESIFDILLSLLFIMISSIFHSGSIMILVGIIAYNILHNKNTDKSIQKFLSICFVVFIIVIFSDVIFLKFGSDGKLNLSDGPYSREAGSRYLKSIYISSVSDIFKYGWIKSIYFVASPTPLYWRGIGDLVSFFLDSIFYIYAMYKVISSRKKVTMKLVPFYNSLLLGLLFTIFVFGIGTSTAGTAMRHRNKIFTLLLVLLACAENYIIEDIKIESRRIRMENKTNNFTDLIQYLRKNMLTILILTLVFGGLGYGFTKYIITPTYTSNTTMIVGHSNQNNDPNNPQAAVELSQINANKALISTYSEIVKSKGIADRVIANLGLDMDYEEFSNKVSIEPVKDTQIISVKVVDTIPERAQDIANETANIFKSSIGDIMNVDNVQILDGASLPEEPSSPKVGKNTAIGIMLGFILGIAIVMIKELTDTRIKSSEDVTAEFDIPVLGLIPDRKKFK